MNMTTSESEPCRVRLHRHKLDLAEYRDRTAQESDYRSVTTESTLVEDADSGRVEAVYLAHLPDDTTALEDVLRRVRVAWNTRTGGMPSQSRTFGARPRIRIHDDYCSLATLARDDPAAHAVLEEWAGVAARHYQRFGPEVYARHLRAAQRVLPAWLIRGTPFSSGIVNRDNPLPYHHDRGNVKNAWSAMLGFKRGCVGGYLALPEYDIAFEIADRSLLLFDGQRVLHGVTPFTVALDGWRFTVVYYTLEQMWRCLPPGEELARIRRKRAQRENTRTDTP